MEIIKNEDARVIEIWLTKLDQQDADCMNLLEPLFKKWNEEKYLPVIYRSGYDDLYDNTLTLLKHNRKVFIRREVESEKNAI